MTEYMQHNIVIESQLSQHIQLLFILNTYSSDRINITINFLESQFHYSAASSEIMARSCSKEFASDYLLLNPEKVGLSDLFHILFSKDLEKREFIDCPARSLEECTKHRWIIFASIVVQKLLLLVAKPMARFGFALEYCFNLVSSNRGIFGLLENFFGGQLLNLFLYTPFIRS